MSWIIHGDSNLNHASSEINPVIEGKKECHDIVHQAFGHIAEDFKRRKWGTSYDFLPEDKPLILKNYKKLITDARSSTDLQKAIQSGEIQVDLLIEATFELVQDFIRNDNLKELALGKELKSLFEKIEGIGNKQEKDDQEISSVSITLAIYKNCLKSLLDNKRELPKLADLNVLKQELQTSKDTTLINLVYLKIENALQIQALIAELLEKLQDPNKLNIDEVIKDYQKLQEIVTANNRTIPQTVQQEFTEKVMLPFCQQRASPALKKVLEGKIFELSKNDLEKIPEELDAFGKLPIPKVIDTRFLAEVILKTNQEEMHNNPECATRTHQNLHWLAQRELVNGNIKNAFWIESRAAKEIPLSPSNPLYEMDKAILETANKNDPKLGAYFSSLDTSVVKGGNLHAVQRMIDGTLINSFDFKISHYARDELTDHLNAIVSNLDEFKAALPPNLCADVKININVPQQFLPFDAEKEEFTRSGGYSPLHSKATEIVFEGVGKIIIGNNKLNGCMYNWIQVEMDANLPDGVGIKKLQQMLALTGFGPVLGKQPSESDERMKIAQLFRAFYPSKATAFDTTKEFYRLPIEELKIEIIAREPGMEALFKEYLEEFPEKMEKIEIMPGKKIWGIKDLGKRMRKEGAWGLMTGVGSNEDWSSLKVTIGKLLTQGALASEQRFQSGIFKKGASLEADFKSGGGDQVFTRMVSDKVAKFGINDLGISGKVQILWNLDTVVQRVPYGYHTDLIGMKNRFLTGPKFGDIYNNYKERLNLIDFVATSRFGLLISNEVMVKNALDQSHIVGIVVGENSEKEDLIQYLVTIGLAEEDATGKFYIKIEDKKIKADDFIHVGKRFQKEWWPVVDH